MTLTCLGCPSVEGNVNAISGLLIVVAVQTMVDASVPSETVTNKVERTGCIRFEKCEVNIRAGNQGQGLKGFNDADVKLNINIFTSNSPW